MLPATGNWQASVVLDFQCAVCFFTRDPAKSERINHTQCLASMLLTGATELSGENKLAPTACITRQPPLQADQGSRVHCWGVLPGIGLNLRIWLEETCNHVVCSTAKHFQQIHFRQVLNVTIILPQANHRLSETTRGQFRGQFQYKNVVLPV